MRRLIKPSEILPGILYLNLALGVVLITGHTWPMHNPCIRPRRGTNDLLFSMPRRGIKITLQRRKNRVVQKARILEATRASFLTRKDDNLQDGPRTVIGVLLIELLQFLLGMWLFISLPTHVTKGMSFNA